MPTIKRTTKRQNEWSQLDKAKRMEVYNNTIWKRLRKAHQMMNPLCEICEMQGKTTLADDVHHLVSFTKFSGADRDAIAFDPNNLISLCKQCHHNIHHGYLRGATTIDEIRERLNNHNEKSL